MVPPNGLRFTRRLCEESIDKWESVYQNSNDLERTGRAVGWKPLFGLRQSVA